MSRARPNAIGRSYGQILEIVTQPGELSTRSDNSLGICRSIDQERHYLPTCYRPYPLYVLTRSTMINTTTLYISSTRETLIHAGPGPSSHS